MKPLFPFFRPLPLSASRRAGILPRAESILSAVLLLTVLLTASSASGLEIRTFTASELGFLVNSHLILGQEQAILVDAQFTRSEAFDVVRLIRQHGRQLTTIFITRGHPEHYLGLEVLKKHYPEARVLARPAVVEAIAEGARIAIERWQPIYLDDLPTDIVLPEAFEEPVLMLDGEEIQLVDLGPTLLYIPSAQTLLASDLVSNQVHLWLETVDPGVWLAHLQKLGDLGKIDFVYPGHGDSAGARLLEESTNYLETLRRAAAGNPAPQVLIDTMMAAFPKHRLPVLLERSAKSFLRGN